MPTFTGIRREKKTRWSVRLGDVVSKAVITIGGIGTIVAVSLVFLFLAYVVAPMFRSAETSDQRTAPLPWGQDKLVRLAIDEYRTLGWALDDAGSLVVFRADTAEILHRKPLFSETKMTAVAFQADSPSVAVGFADGTVRLGRIDIASERIEVEKQNADVRKLLDDLPAGGVMPFAGGIAERLPQGEFRKQTLDIEFKEPFKVAAGAIRLVDHFSDEKRNVVCALSDDGKLVHTSVRRIVAIDGTERLRPGKKVELPFHPRGDAPKKLLLTGLGDGALLAWEDGSAERYDCRAADSVSLAERAELIPGRDAKLTACELLLGRTTIVVGDSLGRTAAWFPARTTKARTVDQQQLIVGHQLSSGPAAVTALSMSARMRMFLAGYADGSSRLIHVTTERTIAEIPALSERDGAAPIAAVAIAPKDDGLYSATKGELWSCHLDPAYPEVSAASLFAPVHYELSDRREFVWQSGGGSSDLEPKLSLTPLIYGTIKATVYSMLFGAPLALLAALYTSEFLKPRVKSRVKPTIELMASLPSVVLGFLAALVLAKVVERRVPEVLSAFVTVPIAVMFGSCLWQLLPRRTAILYQRLRVPLVFVAIVVGVALAFAVGPAAESLLFAGDINSWLNGQTSLPEVEDGLWAWITAQPQGGAGAWFMLLLPTAALGMAYSMSRFVNPWLRRHYGDRSRERFALANLVKFTLGAIATLLIAYLASIVLNAAIFDPRGPAWHDFVNTYDQRNSLIVGFIMGFAIIPIIYTIADDALSTVPEHLRSASLGAGATPWQTAVRVVIPTAMSGLFSALMIGLGRAVGETMIVLMAAGATPIMEMNPFNGFRTLSANIATELPEAARDSAHYRTLFLAALVLFVITFVINTLAEIVRIRFRRRAYQL